MVRRGILFLALALLASWPLAAQNAPGTFAAFFYRFRAAVEQENKPALAGMMAPQFDYLHARNVSPSGVFSALDANGGRQWKNLQIAVQGRPVAVAQAGPYHNVVVLPCVSLLSIYNCFVVFQKNEQSLWQWKAMVMPEK